MTATRTVTTSDGVGLHVELHPVAGSDRPVVLLVAGFAAPATSWAHQVASLTAAGHPVVAVDRRWHGESDRPPYGHRMARHGQDLHEVLTALDLRDVVAVGGSMGANALWAYVDLVGPGRLRALVSIDQTPKMVNGDGWDHGFYGLSHANSGTFFDGGIPRPEGRTPVPPGTEPLLRDHAQQDWRDVVARFDRPLLMVAGRDSEFWPAEHAAAAVAGTRHGRAEVVQDCGHAVNLVRPDAFDAVLLDFLEELR